MKNVTVQWQIQWLSGSLVIADGRGENSYDVDFSSSDLSLSIRFRTSAISEIVGERSIAISCRESSSKIDSWGGSE